MQRMRVIRNEFSDKSTLEILVLYGVYKTRVFNTLTEVFSGTRGMSKWVLLIPFIL